ncbi:MAG: ECF transporter S component [Oscillospiraceae bacterium]|nr:ECF transporter S component [Oscillospiraceae bacterium]
MDKRIKTKELVIIAMVAAVIGVIYTLLDYAYMPLSAFLGTVFMELTFGIYLLSASLPMYLVRKPGIAIFGGLVTAGVNLLLGSPYGLQLVLAGLLQAFGLEIGYAVVDKYQGSNKNMILGAVLAVCFVFCRDGYFWGTPWSYGAAVAAGVVVVRLLSATVIGIILVKVITAALKKTGVLKGFACVK